MKKLDKVNEPMGEQTLQTLNDLKSDKKELKELYRDYLKKAEELRQVLETYQNCRRNSGLHLRRIQQWLKSNYSELSTNYKATIKNWYAAKRLNKENHPI